MKVSILQSVKKSVPEGKTSVSDDRSEVLGGKHGIRFLFGKKDAIADNCFVYDDDDDVFDYCYY